MRFKLLLVSALFGVGILLLPFSYVSYTYQSEMNDEAGLSVSVAQAQSEPNESWSLRSLWSLVMRQVGGVIDVAAQAIEAVTDAPGQLFDITSNDPPDSQAEVQAADPFINGGSQLPFLPVPQIYDGTLIMNVPLQVNSGLSVGGITRLTDLFVSGVFEINDLTVPGLGNFGNIVSGGTQVGSLSVSGDTQLNTLSVAGPVTFANLTANNLTSSNINAGNVTVSNVLVAQGGVTTGGADIDLQGGNIFAANVINELIAGDNIEIGGTANAPIITADVPRISLGSRVRNLNGVSGTLTLVGGADITVSVAGSDITLANTSDLSTVTTRGGCVDCILDADVIDSLSIIGGTIDNTVIGSTTPAQAYFTNITVTDTATSTFGGPINVTSGCVSVNGVCLGIGAVNLDDLLDVSIAGAVDGDFLRYSGASWANASSGALGIGDGSYLGLNDTPDAYIANSLVFVNGAGNALTQSAGLTFDGARLAIGSSSAITTLTVDGDISIVDQQLIRFYETDNTNYVGFRASTTLAGNVVWTLPVSDGAADQILVTDGTGNLRFADVSAVGGGAEVFLALDDTPNSYTASAVPYTASTSDRLLFSSSFVFDGSRLGIGTSSPNHTLTVNGSVYLGHNITTPGLVYNNTRNTVSIGTTLSEEKFTVAQGSILQRGGTSTELYTPSLVGSVNLPDSTYNVFVDGDYAYTVGRSSAAEFNVIDISNKGAPSVIGFVNLPDTARDVVAVGDYAYAVTDVSGNDFHVIDVSDPSSPFEVNSLPLNTSAYSVAVAGRYAYAGTGVITGDEFFIIDVLDPTNPVEVGSLEISANVNAIAVQGDYAYILTDSPSNLISILITDPTAPVIVDTVPLTAAGTAISLRGDHAFVVTNLIDEDFHIFDISDPATITNIGSLALVTGANDVFVAGRYAYVTTSGTGDDLHVIDISDLTEPVEVGSVELNSGAAWGVRVRGRYAYLTTDSAGTDFHIYDVTGIEAQSMLAHSLESGNLSVIGGIVAGGSVNLKRGLRVGVDGIQSEGELLVRSASSSLVLGNLGVGTTSAPHTLTVGGDVSISGAIYDSAFSAGGVGQVLVANGAGQVWTATSSLGLSSQFTTSAGLAALLSDETGTAGNLVFSTSPTLSGTVQVSALTASAALSLSGTAANISLGSNFLSGDGDDEGVYVDVNGFVGIGTTTPSAKLSVTGTGTTTGLSFLLADATNAPNFMVLDNGQTMIGTTTTANFFTLDAGTAASGDAIDILIQGQRGAASGNFGFGGDVVINPGESGQANLDGFVRIGSNGISRMVFGGTDRAGFVSSYGLRALFGQNIYLDQFNNIVTGDGGSAGTLGYAGMEANQGTLNFYAYPDTPELYGGVTVTPTSRMFINTDGKVGVGTTTPASELSVEGTIMASNLYGSVTTLSTDAQGNIIRTPSDGTLKQNVRPIDNALEAVLALRGVRYEWIDATRFGDQTEIGFIAQEVDLILPEVVRKGGEYWSLNTPNIVAVLVEAIQEIWEVVTGNQEKIELLETRVEYLETLMDVEPAEPPIESNANGDDDSADTEVPPEENSSGDETVTSSDESATADNEPTATIEEETVEGTEPTPAADPELETNEVETVEQTDDEEAEAEVDGTEAGVAETATETEV